MRVVLASKVSRQCTPANGPVTQGMVTVRVADAPHEVARVIEVEHPFRDVDLATACGPQLEERDGEVQAQREVLDQFVFADWTAPFA